MSVINLQEAADNLPRLFDKAREVYGQQEGTLYKSWKSINNLNLVVLPERDQYEFSSYNAGDPADVGKLRALNQQGIFKTYTCSLCGMQEADNAVIISDEQNQLYIKEDSPSTEIDQEFQGTTGLSYVISGTVPQYYYNHLLLMTTNHIPTYAVFMDNRVFYDVMMFLKEATPKVRNQNLYAYFNGNAGSEIFHFHTHLTDQTSTVLDRAVDTVYPKEGVFNFASDFIRMGVFSNSNLNQLINDVINNMVYVMQVRERSPNLLVTANFFYRKERFWCTVQVSNKSKQVWNYNNCTSFLFPTSFQLLMNQCFVPPKNQAEYAVFRDSMATHFDQFYVAPDSYLTQATGQTLAPYRQFEATFKDLPLRDIMAQPTVEKLYVWMELRRVQGLIGPGEAKVLLRFIMNQNCLVENACPNNMDMGRFKYILGLGINNADAATLREPGMTNVYIASQWYHLRELNKSDNIKSDYMYFRGKYIQNLILRTINSLLVITHANQAGGILEETQEITKWMKHTFKRIGEASASGVNTVTEIDFFPDIDMVMKIMATPTIEKKAEFNHEFWASMGVNDIRALIPNYILCFGGFYCDSSSFQTLCDRGPGKNTSYLLLENVKNSRTLGRHLQLPVLAYEQEANDLLDGIYQLIVGLSFGWNLKHFTHYDLHINNIMEYDFITNKDYLKLFKIYSEQRGDAVPPIKKVLFRYHLQPGQSILVPAKYLYLIIDYGRSYVDGMPAGSHHTVPVYVNKYGMSSDRPNEVFDVYTLLMSFFASVLQYKPYLLIDIQTNAWKPNMLYRLLKKTLEAYGELWKDTPGNMLRQLLVIQERRESVSGYFWNMLRDSYRVGDPKYLSVNLAANKVHADFRGPVGAVNWLYANHYSHLDLEDLARDSDVYVFNWGYLPEGTLMGVQPTEQIDEMIEQKKERTIEFGKVVKGFMNSSLVSGS